MLSHLRLLRANLKSIISNCDSLGKILKVLYQNATFLLCKKVLSISATFLHL